MNTVSNENLWLKVLSNPIQISCNSSINGRRSNATLPGSKADDADLIPWFSVEIALAINKRTTGVSITRIFT
jgi:hypothetical protein